MQFELECPVNVESRFDMRDWDALCRQMQETGRFLLPPSSSLKHPTIAEFNAPVASVEYYTTVRPSATCKRARARRSVTRHRHTPTRIPHHSARPLFPYRYPTQQRRLRFVECVFQIQLFISSLERERRRIYRHQRQSFLQCPYHRYLIDSGITQQLA